MAKKPLSEIEKIIKNTPLPKYNKQISYSQFSTYLTCPNKWYLKYNQGNYIDKQSIHFCFGTAMHETLQEYIKIMYNESGTNADKIPSYTNFENKFINEYKESLKQNKNIHFSTPEELREFNNDGLEIIQYFKKKRSNYFSIKNIKLLGIELPLIAQITDKLHFKGLIDIVIYDKDLDKVIIYDFKTSTNSWKDYQKKDETKIFQLLLYKKYFSEIYNYPIEKIDIQFIILKRKHQEHEEYSIPRIQTFSPSSGKNSINKMSESFNYFINDCFNENGEYIQKEYKKNVTTFNCQYCQFNGNLCK